MPRFLLLLVVCFFIGLYTEPSDWRDVDWVFFFLLSNIYLGMAVPKKDEKP